MPAALTSMVSTTVLTIRKAPLRSTRRSCDCRKPQPGLLRQAASELDLDLARSWVVGDRWHDLQAGTAVGARGLLVRTGYGREAERTTGVGAVGIVDDLIAAASWIFRTS